MKKKLIVLLLLSTSNLIISSDIPSPTETDTKEALLKKLY